MVIGKISSLATTIFIFALGAIFLKQAYATSIGASGQDVGRGLTSASAGITSVFDSFISPITGLIGTFSSFFGALPNDARTEPSQEGRNVRQEPTPTTGFSRVGSTTTNTFGTTTTSAGGYVKAVGVASYLR
jgi:hypothetical protein